MYVTRETFKIKAVSSRVKDILLNLTKERKEETEIDREI